MTALDRKLLRDFWGHRGQMASIGALVAVGVMTVLTMRGTYEALVGSQERYYVDARFPDVWSALESAPEAVRRRIEQLPGVSRVETRISFRAPIHAPAATAMAQGLFVSLPERRRPDVGDVHLTSGRYLSVGRRDEAIVSQNFAEANRLGDGDTLRAVLNGRSRRLEIVGIAISP